MTPAETKFKRVMHEYGQGKLKSHGAPVTDQKQAIAIAFSEARKANSDYKDGSRIKDFDINSLIGKAIWVPNSMRGYNTIISIEKITDDNIKVETQPVGLISTLTESYTLQELKKLSDGKKIRNGIELISEMNDGAKITDKKYIISVGETYPHSGGEALVKRTYEEDGKAMVDYEFSNDKITAKPETQTLKTFIRTITPVFDNGGPIKNQYAGKTPEHIWNLWTPIQRAHFIMDHFDDKDIKLMLKGKTEVDVMYDDIPMPFKYWINEQLEKHISEGQYNEGGKILTKGTVINIPEFGGDKNVKMTLKEIEPLSKKDIKEGLGSYTYHFVGTHNRSQWYPETKLKERLKKNSIEIVKKMNEGGKLTPAKKKLQARINKLTTALADIKAPGARKAMQAKIDKLQREFDHNPSIKEKIAAQKGMFYLDIPTKYSKQLYRKLWDMGIKSKLNHLNGNTKVVMNHSAKLEKAYKVYSDILKEKGEAVPALSKIKGKL